MPPPQQCLAVIPARGGSKRIPRKNIRPFHGLPLIVRPIETALASGLFRDVIVSTDDDEIATVAEQAGAPVPFRRAVSLSDDVTPLQPVVADAVVRYGELTGAEVTHVCLVYPAAVFTLRQDLRDSLELLVSRHVDHVFSACSHPAPILRAWREDEGGCAEMIWPEHRMTRSQDLPETFYDCGQFAWGTTNYWLGNGTSAELRSALFRLPRNRAHDIDTEEDWHVAQALFGAIS